MNESDFVARGENDWEELRKLALKLDSRAKKVTLVELERFLFLYRQASGDLARAQFETSNPELAEILNRAVTNAYAALYRRPRNGFRRTLTVMLTVVAQTVRRRVWFIFAAFMTFMIAALWAASISHVRPDLKSDFVPPGWESVVDHWVKGEMEPRTPDEGILATSFYASNNPRVAVVTGAVGGSTFGIGSAYLLYMNGTLLGALAYDVAQVGRLGYLLASVAPHGASELTGIFIVGAAGYVFGWALLAPGRRTRLDSLRENGKDGFVLLALGVVMMYIAAPFEGFFSFDPRVPLEVKAVVGALVFGAWITFWATYGRGAEISEEDETTVLA